MRHNSQIKVLLLLIVAVFPLSVLHAQEYSAQSSSKIIVEFLTFHYNSLIYKAENDSIFVYDGADACGPRLANAFQTNLNCQMWGERSGFTYWSAAITWIVELQNDLHVSGNVEISAYISSTFSLGFPDGGGYGMGLVDTDENGTVIKEFIVESQPSYFQNPFTPTPKKYSLSLGVDYVFPKGHLIGFFVGAGSTRQGFTFEVYFDSQDKNSGVTLPVRIPLDIYEYNVVLEEGTFEVVALSNSNLSNFEFSRSEMQISFDVSGLSCTSGYCEVWIPKNLLGGPFKVYINSQQISRTETGNGTHSFVSFTYVHGSSAVRIVGTTAIPEFPHIPIAFLILVLSLVGIVLSIMARKWLNTQNQRSTVGSLSLSPLHLLVWDNEPSEQYIANQIVSVLISTSSFFSVSVWR